MIWDRSNNILQGKTILKHYIENQIFRSLKNKINLKIKNKIFKKILSKNNQKTLKKYVFVTKISNTFDFLGQESKKKKVCKIFLGPFTWNHPR